MENERTVIIREKTEGGALKLAAIVAFVATSPFWFILGVVLIGCFTGIVSNGGAWPFIALLAISLIPVVRDRLSGKNENKKLQARIAQLEMEAADARLALLHLQESIDFDTTLRLHAEKNLVNSGNSSPPSAKDRLVEAAKRN